MFAAALSLVVLCSCKKDETSQSGGNNTPEIPEFGTYIAGDFHQHTGYSDGTNPIKFVYSKAKSYG